ncbi:DUF2283 domain-containing protein [Clavibacter michiganensis]|uniref:DUF2283 domain-containing protein n=1 Tax=Clavibacter michiganensis subsp. insidiosus TaxID=33014 RepID=A0A0D5CI76_9MICO|nr:DUF2283 domain-containing protein [Clavibacter michiganensis]AJW79005.1 hypothetical protein VO01_07560 [Clavibacter michiganensis subsp. insidiosus]AWF98306.1 hypothetical protein BEH61_07280 [Clavibacter michiganensis subsp. insidiosus]AWG01492.1 hypothetical protein BEH62_07790 [Clavibacter michiganensis subsp. insidiosus]OQJ59976.1 hypothetical protein B5P21_08675 [Clavibacter michiganensis subsp. insidiosus]RII88420.1 DUF2283 domain-containing protein [Clavibacter michiganensis subsp. 
MKITYDTAADAAYIQVVPDIKPGQSAEQIHSIATPGNRGEIVLDFDSDGRLLGVEVLQAGDVLSAEVLAAAERPTGA